jgi:hypothetical protein
VSVHFSGKTRTDTPQNFCEHNPCWCGRRPHGLAPYDAEKARQWLAECKAMRLAVQEKSS